MQGEHRPGTVSVAVMATAVMAVGTVPQFVFGTLGPFVVTEFDLSRAQFGGLTTVLFAVAAVLSPSMGQATDRFSARLTYGTVFVVSAVALAGIAVSPSYLILITFSGLGGVGQALVNPLSNRLVADYVPVHRRGLILGIKQSGVQMSAVVAGLSLPVLAVLIGWRAAVGAVAVAAAAGWAASAVRLPSGSPSHGAGHEARPGGADRIVVLLGTYAFLMGCVTAAVSAYLPLYAHEVLGLSAGVAGVLVAAIGVVGITSRIIVGHLADRIGGFASLLNGMSVIGAVAVALIVLAQPLGSGLIWLAAFVFGWSVAWNAVAMIAVVMLRGTNRTGRASGYVLTGFFAGFIIAPVAFGAAVDAVGYTAPWIALGVLLVGISVAIWIWRWRTGRR